MAISRKRVLNFLDYLMDASPSESSSPLQPQYRVFREEHIRWAQNDNIIGYGFVGSNFYQPNQKGASIVFYAQSDDAISSVKRKAPKELEVPGLKGKIPVQIVNIGDVQPQGPRPAQPGTSVSHDGIPYGTFGLVVTRPQGENTFILSSAHVLTHYGAIDQNKTVISPGHNDDGTHSDRIGVPFDAVPIHYDDHRYLNTVDAAIALVDDPNDVSPEIVGLGNHNGISNTIRRGMVVTKSGRASSVTIGEVMDAEARIRLPYPRGATSTSKAGFHDVVLCSRFSQPGDSGAAVLSKSSKKVVGIIMAGSATASVFCKIKHVVEQLRIEL